MTFSDEYYKKSVDLILGNFRDESYKSDPEILLSGTLELLSHFLRLSKGRIYLWDTPSWKLKIAYSHGLTTRQVNVGCYEVDEGITGEVLDRGKTIIVTDVVTDHRFKGKIASITPEDKRLQSYIAVPLLHDDIALGVLAVECNASGDGDIEANALVLKLIAEEISLVIDKYDLNDFASYHAA